MNESIENLLQPVSAERPCGPDLSSDPMYDELTTILKGKPEVDIGSIHKPAEPPDWREMRDKSAAYLARSKHLRVAVMLSCGLLKTGGLAAFLDGLQLIRGLLEQYWAALYPLLDPEDNNDPTQRLNMLSALTAPRGSMAAGWLTVVDYLYTVPVFQPKGAAAINFDQIIGSRKPAEGAEGAAPAPGVDPARLAAQIRAAGADQIAVHRQTLEQMLEAVHGIDQFLTTTLGSTNTISFDMLEKSLRELLGALAPFLPVATGEVPAETATAAEPGSSPGPAAITVHGAIRSREDVVHALESICDYYEQVEPGSPVPYLLRRAQKIARMNFVEAVQELNLATPDTLRPTMGSTVDGEPGSQSPAA